MKIDKTIFPIIIAFTAGFLLGMIFTANIHELEREAGNGVIGSKDAPASLRSQSEVQQFLLDEGYYIGKHGVDGVIGEASRDAWDRYINDQYGRGEL
jgi:hypothetical protein